MISAFVVVGEGHPPIDGGLLTLVIGFGLLVTAFFLVRGNR